jgi:hypothetical protein
MNSLLRSVGGDNRRGTYKPSTPSKTTNALKECYPIRLARNPPIDAQRGAGSPPDPRHYGAARFETEAADPPPFLLPECTLAGITENAPRRCVGAAA